MCIIAYKPQNTKFPSKDILARCYENNPDGAGYMFTAKQKVFIRKGFMSFGSFYDSLEKDKRLFGQNLPYVMHFRISTQAGIRKDCCHPFPLSGNMDSLRALRSKCNIGIAHNGIISLTSNGFRKSITYSDTMEFITDYLTLIIKSLDWHKDDDKKTLIDRLCQGKLAILGKDGHCELIGDWIEDDGIFYSNESYGIVRHTKFIDTKYEWDDWYEDCMVEGFYDFDEDCCPFIIEGDNSYCRKCTNFGCCTNLDYGEEEFYLES